MEFVSVDDTLNSKQSTKTNTDQTVADECNNDNDGSCTDDEPVS